MRECENEKVLSFKEAKKESCNVDDNYSSTQRQSYLTNLESKHSKLNTSISNNMKKNTNNLSEMDSSLHESHSIVESVRMIDDTPVRTYSKKRKKKTLTVPEVICQETVKLENSDSSLLIDLKNDYASEDETIDETIEDYSFSKRDYLCSSQQEKKRIFDDVDVDENELETAHLDETRDVSKTDSHQEVKSISDESCSNTKKKPRNSGKKEKELLDDKSKKKLEQLVKSALEKSENNKEKNKRTTERKAQSKESHAHELKPKDIKEEFKTGEKVLVKSYNGEVTGPFVIAKLLGKLSCKIRLVSAVSSGENGLFSNENEEKLKTEWLQNLIPFKKKTDSSRNSIKSPCSDEHMKSDGVSETNFPKKLIIDTPNFYSNKNKKKNNKKKWKKLKRNFNETFDSAYKCKSSFTETENTAKTKINFNLRKKETQTPKNVESGPVVEWVKSLKLDSSHKEILLDEETCLTTDIIDSANHLIRKKWSFVDGLRTPFQVQSSTGFPAMKGGGVQILFDEEREHWFTASNMREHVEIADSMVPDSLSYSAKRQIVQCFRDYEENGILKVHMLPVCQQDNEIDCGLYAIANAIEFICEDGDPLHPYIRSNLREHLIECFEKGEIQRFPKPTLGTAKRSINQPKKTKVEIIMANKILERCDRVVKRTVNKSTAEEIVVELISSDSE